MRTLPLLCGCLGALLAVSAMADMLRMKITTSEKAAYYIFGHWLDAFWQVQLPVLAAGIILGSCALIRWR